MRALVPEVLPKQPVDLSGHDEIALGEAVDLVRPQSHLGLSPGQQNIGRVSLFFRQRSDAVHKLERLFEIRKSEGAGDVVLPSHLPLGDSLVQRFEFLALERRHSAGARDAFLVG